MAVDPEQIPWWLPDPETHAEDVVMYYQYADGYPRFQEAIAEAKRPSPVGPRYEPICLKKKRRDFVGLVWHPEYLRWDAQDGTRRRKHAGMLIDPELVSMLEDVRRKLARPKAIGESRDELAYAYGYVPVHIRFIAVRHVHTIVGWAEHQPRRS